MTQPLNMYGAVDLSALKNSPPAPAAANGGEGFVRDVTDASFPAIMETSRVVPVVVDLWAEWCQPCKTLGPILEKLAAEYGGRFILAKIDVDANPQVAGAFQVQSIPTVIGLVGGQPVPLFQGAYPESQIRQVLDQLLEVAAANGVTGTVSAAPAGGAEEEPAEPPLPPLHAEGLQKFEAGDFEGAEEAFIAALKENPADSEAKSALSRIALWRRLEGTDPATLIGAAVDGDLDSQLAAADAEFGSMDLAAAFGRLLTLVRAGGDLREPARTRLLEFFEMIGPHPEVNAARRALASALY